MQMLSLKRCCNIIVDLAATASQNVFRTFMVSPHEKTNIIKKITKKNLITTVFYHREVVKQKIIIWHICWVI
jgi:hypothetical protein